MANPITGSSVTNSNPHLRILVYVFFGILFLGAAVYVKSTQFYDSAPDFATVGYIASPNGMLVPEHSALLTFMHQGYITGLLLIPDYLDLDPKTITVCAESSVQNGRTYCTKDLVEKPDSQGWTFELKVPQGTYYVFSKQEGSKYKAYYDNWVACGGGPSCETLPIIPVVVQSGKTTDRIYPGDWSQAKLQN